MRANTPRRGILFATLLFSLSLNLGCGSQGSGPPAAPLTADQQIQRIQANTHMPEAAKQRAIQMIHAMDTRKPGPQAASK